MIYDYFLRMICDSLSNLIESLKTFQTALLANSISFSHQISYQKRKFVDLDFG
jgi:hypothetical protein